MKLSISTTRSLSSPGLKTNGVWRPSGIHSPTPLPPVGAMGPPVHGPVRTVWKSPKVLDAKSGRVCSRP